MFANLDGLLGFESILPSAFTVDQPDSYFAGLLQQGCRDLAACERIFRDWGAAIAWRQRSRRWEDHQRSAA